MDQQVEKEEALSQATAQIVKELAKDEPLIEVSRFNLYELLGLYNFGIDRVGPANFERWTLCFSLAASTNGVFCLRAGSEIRYLAIFWRTKNPHVNLAREIPKPDEKGSYAYLGWTWNVSAGGAAYRALKEHILMQCGGAEFIAWHDQRQKVKKARRGKLWVMEVD